MKRFFLYSLLIILVTACATPQTVEPTSTATSTLPPTAIEPTATATEIPFAALSPEEQVTQFLDGKITDISSLNLNQHATFSKALAETLNLTAKEITYKNGEAFLDPRTLTMVTGSEHPEDLVFKPAYALTENPDGTYAYTDQWGETHQLVGLDKNDQHHIVTDATTDLINFPQVDIHKSGDYAGMSYPQVWLAESYSSSTPEHKQDGLYANDIAFLRQMLGKAYFDKARGRLEPSAVLEFGKVIRDASGKPVLLYKFLVTPLNNGLLAYQEGEDWKEGVNNTTEEYQIANMQANHMVWLGTYGTELASVFYYTPQNAIDWARLDLHTQATMDFLQKSTLPQSKIPVIEGRIVIFEASN